ncbi:MULTISPECIES: hypothetical protein [unclassified Arthrobacter]|uniref:hypothetical protein n=1 Tax=unclassified Arthrobacter TaxID=235627 RepID=UPI002E12A9E2|nr:MULTISPECIES: hypothetical protein [unclassified Arthrobacter]
MAPPEGAQAREVRGVPLTRHQEEFRIAVTDAVCRDKTGFHSALDKVLDKHLRTRMQKLALQIEKVKEIRRTAGTNAATLRGTATR